MARTTSAASRASLIAPGFTRTGRASSSNAFSIYPLSKASPFAHEKPGDPRNLPPYAESFKRVSLPVPSPPAKNRIITTHEPLLDRYLTPHMPLTSTTDHLRGSIANEHPQRSSPSIQRLQCNGKEITDNAATPHELLNHLGMISGIPLFYLSILPLRDDAFSELRKDTEAPPQTSAQTQDEQAGSPTQEFLARNV